MMGHTLDCQGWPVPASDPTPPLGHLVFGQAQLLAQLVQQLVQLRQGLQRWEETNQWRFKLVAGQQLEQSITA